jgi:hypothetical protein
MAFGERLNEGWCLEQLSGYGGRGIKRKYVEEMLNIYNATRKYFFVFEIANGVVNIRSKPAFFQDAELHESADASILRAVNYRNFFQDVVRLHNIEINTVFGMEVPDEVFESQEIPVFGYQKQKSDKLILMPDIDFLHYEFYRNQNVDDIYEYNKKEPSAIFVGATTGAGVITKESIANGIVPRINSAKYFKDNKLVSFKLPDVVQVDSDEVRSMIADMGISGERREWSEQLKYKFLISMDGNGATCSRVIISLKSNSVLLKYLSPNQLYYFSGLIPWYNFIPIHADDDVLRIVEIERREPGRFEFIAKNGQDFYNMNLQREHVFEYVALLINGYNNIIN